MSKASWQLPYHQIFIDAHPELGLTEVPEGWDIHHKNGDHSDNHPDNLQLMTHSDHLSLHHKGIPNPKVSKAQKGIPKPKTSESLRGRKLSEEHKENLRIAWTKRVPPSKRIQITEEMANDKYNGMPFKEWKDKYKVSRRIWDRITNN